MAETVVGRVCPDMLRSRQSRREEPLDAHLPDIVARRVDTTDLEHEAMLADSMGSALLVVLETLAPAERLAFVLHDMFAVRFHEIAPIVGCSPTAARQLASRARRRVQGAAAVPYAFSGRARFGQPALVNGAVGAVWAPGGRPRAVFGITIAREDRLDRGHRRPREHSRTRPGSPQRPTSRYAVRPGLRTTPPFPSPTRSAWRDRNPPPA